MTTCGVSTDMSPAIGIGIGLPFITPGAGGGGGDPAEITVNAVEFDGTNDWLERDGDWTGSADGQQGTFVFWVKMNGADNTQFVLYDGSSSFIQILRLTTNKIELRLNNSVATLLLNLLSTTEFTGVDGWTCILMSWDLSAALKAHLYFGDVDKKTEVTKIQGTVDYTRIDHGFGATIGGGSKTPGCFAQVYFNPEEYIDFSVESNRRKFISVGGKPVDLGSDGSDPTGSVPILFLSGPTVSWHTNDGDGGGMTEFGALTDCATSPSD